MKLYIYEDYKKMFPQLQGRSLTDMLIAESLKNCGIKGCRILRTKKGKPYVDLYEGGYHGQEDVHFSVSHSGPYFACLISSVPVGIDVQQYRNADAARIGNRYFTEAERRYIEARGEDGFFFIWARKEAYAKYTGRGLEEIMAGTPVLDRRDVEFIDFQLEKGVQCSCCIMIKKDERDI